MAKANVVTPGIDAQGNLTAGHFCGCGCNQIITSKATYRPGHDATHVSMLLAELFNEVQDGGKVTKTMVHAQAKALPSEALRTKFEKAAERAFFAVKAPKPAKVEEPATDDGWVDENPGYTEGEIKIGRWTYPTRTWEGGIVERNTKPNGSGEWVRVEG